MSAVKELRDVPSPSQEAVSTQTAQSPSSTAHREDVPKEPQFVGPTRSAFGLMIGERSLTRMGIPMFESCPPSGAQSPTHTHTHTATMVGADKSYWSRCTASDVAKYLGVFQEEVEAVYPFIDIGQYAFRSQEILDAIRNSDDATSPVSDVSGMSLSSTDRDIVKVATATGIVLDTHGRNDVSSAILEPVERSVSRILSPEVDLKEIQLITMLVGYPREKP